MKKSKYRAVPTVVDGIRFHSKAEARRYGELKLLERAGKITTPMRQVEIILYVRERPIGKYIADFVYRDNETRSLVYEDVKGFRTPLYRWKKKHFEAQYGIKITEVK